MIAVIGSAVCATAVQAQPRAVQRLERQLQAAEEQYLLRASPELSVGERAVIDYGVLANFSFMAVDDTGDAWVLSVQAPVTQTEFGVKTYSLLMGSMKVADEVTIGFTAKRPQ